MTISCIDLFCGAGGLTHGFVKEKLPVKAGIDVDEACRFPYEANNKSTFLNKSVADVTSDELRELFGDADITILAGCAPCQPFSTYSHRYNPDRNDRWGLLYEFGRLVEGTLPTIVTMENVPSVMKHKVFNDFVSKLESLGYHTYYKVVDSTHYGVPQTRKRLVLLASLLGPIHMIERTHHHPRTVRQAIGKLKSIEAGETSERDKLHTSPTLSDLNLLRIKASKPGGTWRDWPNELVAKCHREHSGRTFSGVYGRMEWDKPAPTMTTQCYGFGNGRFGHPEQNRAISLREAAIIQGFPRNYKFASKKQDLGFKSLGRMIGNAVPVGLGQAIAKSIKIHLNQ